MQELIVDEPTAHALLRAEVEGGDVGPPGFEPGTKGL